MRDESSRYVCPVHANCHGTSSMSLVQRQRRCDGRTRQAETSEQQLDGGGHITMLVRFFASVIGQ